jgi:hypothetical protein
MRRLPGRNSFLESKYGQTPDKCSFSRPINEMSIGAARADTDAALHWKQCAIARAKISYKIARVRGFS